MGPSAEATTIRRATTGGTTMSDGSAVRQMLLFAGAVRPTPLLKAAARNVLDLPLLDGQTVGTRWLAALEELGAALGITLPLRILTDRKSPAPTSTNHDRTTVEQPLHEAPLLCPFGRPQAPAGLQRICIFRRALRGS